MDRSPGGGWKAQAAGRKLLPISRGQDFSSSFVLHMLETLDLRSQLGLLQVVWGAADGKVRTPSRPLCMAGCLLDRAGVPKPASPAIPSLDVVRGKEQGLGHPRLA